MGTSSLSRLWFAKSILPSCGLSPKGRGRKVKPYLSPNSLTPAPFSGSRSLDDTTQYLKNKPEFQGLINSQSNFGKKTKIRFCLCRHSSVAATKSLQSCPTLCDPIDGSPPGPTGPWDSPGKNTGMGCHFLLQCMKVKSEIGGYSLWESTGLDKLTHRPNLACHLFINCVLF